MTASVTVIVAYDTVREESQLGYRDALLISGRRVATHLHIPWQRFWLPRGEALPLSHEGYLRDPADGGEVASKLVSLKALLSTHCVALLGEPGMGKTTTLEQEKEVIQDHCRRVGAQLLWRDLAAFGDEGRLVRALFEGDVAEKWKQGDLPLYLVLDGFDECHLRIETLSKVLLSELRELPVERLFLFIACRPAHWPRSFENGLRKLWTEGGFAAVELAPLRRRDVEQLARVREVDAAKFLQEVAQRDATALAIRPVTLEFLLRAFKQGRLPSERWPLYFEGCSLLAQENDESRAESGPRGHLGPAARLAVASRLAGQRGEARPWDQEESPRDLHSIQGSIWDALRNQASREACQALERLNQEVPGQALLRLALIHAQGNFRSETWQPPGPRELLGRLQRELHGETPALEFLWNEWKQEGEPVRFKPKKENQLSDWIKRHLMQDLSGRRIVVNREVEIRPTEPLRSGQRTDLLVQAIAPGAEGRDEAISVIIEVKGCWNVELWTAMREQLVGRYLAENACQHGIYLVGWYACAHWDETRAHPSEGRVSTQDRARQLLEEQARALSQGNVRVRSFVLDAAFRVEREAPPARRRQ